MADLQSTVKVKTLNSERSQLLHEEALKNLEHLQLEREKLTQKIEVHYPAVMHCTANHWSFPSAIVKGTPVPDAG